MKKKVFCIDCEHYKKDGIWHCYSENCFDYAIDPKNGKTIRARKKDKYDNWYNYLTFNKNYDCKYFEPKLSFIDSIKNIVSNIKTFFQSRRIK